MFNDCTIIIAYIYLELPLAQTPLKSTFICIVSFKFTATV